MKHSYWEYAFMDSLFMARFKIQSGGGVYCEEWHLKKSHNSQCTMHPSLIFFWGKKKTSSGVAFMDHKSTAIMSYCFDALCISSVLFLMAQSLFLNL